MIHIPDEIRLTRDHAWIIMEDEFIGRCGISEPYQRYLDGIVFVEFPDINMEVKMGDPIARVESGKDIADVRSPVSGRITEINGELELDPGRINADPYGDGWLFKLEVKEPNEFHELLSPEEYENYLETQGDI